MAPPDDALERRAGQRTDGLAAEAVAASSRPLGATMNAEETPVPEPLVTIAIPTYNRSDGYLREALASALAQDYAPLEIVVVDNASQDATPEYVASIADPRLRYARNPKNLGVNGNFNACVAQARGEYVLVLHDDDRVDPDFVTACMDAVRASRSAAAPGMVRTGTRVVDAQGAVLLERANGARGAGAGGLALDWFAERTSLYFCSTLFHTAALREAGGFHSRRELYIDVAAVFRIAAQHPVVDVADVKASFRRHGGNNGTAQSILAWCEDSTYLLDLACELSPERAEEIRAIGTPYFIRSNFHRATRIDRLGDRLRAFWSVYRHFAYPVLVPRLIASRGVRRLAGARRGSSA